MPELPEVETIRLQLCANVLGKKIKEVVIKDARVIKGVSKADFKSKVEHKIVKNVIRRGKVLILELASNLYLIIHLRISGWLVLSKTYEKFCRVGLVLNNGKILNFCDSRVLGEIKLTDNWHNLSIIKRMGPEPLTLKKDAFRCFFRGRKTQIKPLLMDQTFLAGIGNIYAQEAVFCAGIHPKRKADSLNKQELGKLYSCLVRILNKAIIKKGSSVDTYRQVSGESGGYLSFLKVYQRENKTCFLCGSLIKRIVAGGRGTYFCPKCQT